MRAHLAVVALVLGLSACAGPERLEEVSAVALAPDGTVAATVVGPVAGHLAVRADGRVVWQVAGAEYERLTDAYPDRGDRQLAWLVGAGVAGTILLAVGIVILVRRTVAPGRLVRGAVVALVIGGLAGLAMTLPSGPLPPALYAVTLAVGGTFLAIVVVAGRTE
jgi:hypothetical protein